MDLVWHRKPDAAFLIYITSRVAAISYILANAFEDVENVRLLIDRESTHRLINLPAVSRSQ